MTTAIETCVEKSLSSAVPEIERVLAGAEGDVLEIFSVIADEDEDTLDRIYQLSATLCMRSLHNTLISM